MTSIKDVAQAAGVSTATVSRVLANKPYVSPEVRQRVLEAVERLGYRPNLVARGLRAQQTNTIGLLVSDIRNPYFTDVSRAVEDLAYEHGFTLFLGNTDENPQKETLYLQSMRDHNVAGLIFSPTRQASEHFTALGLTIPTVVIDRAVREGDVDMVLIDNLEAAYRLTQHLLEQGYTRLAGLFGEMSVTGRERQRGFEKALREHGLAPLQMRFLPPYIQAGYEATRALLQAAPRPDAILATNSLLLAGALKAIREAGLPLPEAIGLAGFDETTWTPLVEPPLTVIAQPTYEIGRMAMRMLLERLEDPNLPYRQVILKGQLLVRRSTLRCAGV
ncbi:LacI family DNA-binding transcriptional regulator [uncultured Thermanaerothrix sp.]|uniref:LacI family DNA-binding transcriptional regulator n=1 Tax=uncultured Thermanaerothrix sp. TaxID=1195149 RepID=UPI0026361E23|nr:LacI family DNA-binding transcriptional regulator [uncultured Thermanaerothrix sp.]